MLAWALLKNKDYDAATHSFQRAVELNPNIVGALAGLMWCAIFTGNKEMACQHALAKAAVRKDAPDKVRAFVDKKFGV